MKSLSVIVLIVCLGMSYGQPHTLPNPVEGHPSKSGENSQNHSNTSIQISIDTAFTNEIASIRNEIKRTADHYEAIQEKEGGAYPIKNFWMRWGIEDWSITVLTLLVLVTVGADLVFSLLTFLQLRRDSRE